MEKIEAYIMGEIGVHRGNDEGSKARRDIFWGKKVN